MGLLEDLLIEELPMQMAAMAPETAPSPTMPAVGPARMPAPMAPRPDIPWFNRPDQIFQSAVQPPPPGVVWDAATNQYIAPRSIQYETERVKALQNRDKTQMGIMEVIGRLDPAYQAAVLQRLGIPVQPQNSKLEQEMMLKKFAHELGAGERAEELGLKRQQVQAGIQSKGLEERYKQEMLRLRDEQLRVQKLSHLDNLSKAIREEQMAVKYNGADPKMLRAMVAQFLALTQELGGVIEGEGGGVPPPATSTRGGSRVARPRGVTVTQLD